jgi:hypothetical protein
VWGESDVLVPAAFSRHVAAAMPDARQVILPECGHVPQVELPERTNALIAEHIEGVAPAGAPVRRPRMARRLAGALARSA